MSQADERGLDWLHHLEKRYTESKTISFCCKFGIETDFLTVDIREDKSSI